MKRTLPSSTSSLIAPIVSSIGVTPSGRWYWYRSITSVRRRLSDAVDGDAHVLARAAVRRRVVGHRVAELRGEHDAVATPLERLAEQVLAAAAVAVDVRGVEERDAHLERGVHDRARALLVDARAEVVAAEPDDRDVGTAGAERAGPHGPAA